MGYKKLTYTLIIILSLIIMGFTNDIYFQISKSFEIFSSIYRLVLENYVLKIDTETMFRSGIDGMLKSLDPYTEYYDEADTEDLEYLASGAYTGLGISVSTIDSQLTITRVLENYPAYNSGIRVGDRIYKIDTNIVLNISSEDLRKYTKGEQGSKLTMLVINTLNDTSSHIITREIIQTDNISIAEVLDSNVAYIKLDKFTRTSASDVKQTIYTLRKGNNLQGLILDLRDNPGGLLDAAIKICELFLPENSLVVTTKRRDNEKIGEYTTFNKPLEPDIPLCILINENSASASEIVAGAIQDYDRGVIVGKKSFGKGLVQSIFDVPYNGHIKMTTSKYYTPSGRCIQRLGFAEKYQNKFVKNTEDTIQYTTKNGRKVYDLTGILPDSIINEDYDCPLLVDFLDNSLFFKFANDYVKKYPVSKADLFKKDDELFGLFQKFVAKSDIKYTNNLIKAFNETNQELEKNKLNKQSIEELKKLENNVKSYLINNLGDYKETLLQFIKYELYIRVLNENDVRKILIKNDPTVIKSVNILTNKSYKKLLSPLY